MKKSILFIFALMAAMSLSCKKEALTDGSGSENSGNTTGEYAYTIKGTFASEDDAAAGDSKVGIGKEGENNYFGTWEEGDQVVIYEVVQAQTSRERITEEPIVVSNISEDGKSADIRFNIRENVPLQPPTPSGQTTPPDKVPLDENTKCRAFYYSDALMDLKYGQGILAAEQVQKGTGLENTSLKKYAFIYTTSEASVKNKVKNPSDYCKFYHALSYVDISFSSTDFAGWKVDKIVMKKDSDGTALAGGTYNINCSVAPAPIASRASAMTIRGANVKKEISLTFEDPVTLSKDSQSAWMVAFPTYIYNESDGYYDKDKHDPVPQYHYVYFQLSKDGALEYAKVRFKTCLKGGCVKKLKVGAITKADITNDYKEIYDAGLDIVIGDLVVNKTTFPTAKLMKPEEFTAYSTFAGGLVFVDDITSQEVVNLGTSAGFSANIAISSEGNLVVVGRYKNQGSQTQFNVVDMRPKYDVAFLNLRLNLKRYNDSNNPGQCLFEKQSNQKTVSALRLVDCYLDVAQATSAGQHSTVAVIRDRASNGTNIAAPFSKVLVDNCVVKLSSRKDKPKEASTKLYYHFASPTDDDIDIDRSVDITNNIIFSEYTCINNIGISFCTGADKIPTKSPKLSVNFSGNTVVGSCGQDGVLYYGPVEGQFPVKSFIANNNLGYFENIDNLTYQSPKFAQAKGTTDKITGNSNWIGSANAYYNYNDSKGNHYEGQAMFQAWSISGTNISSQTVDPFTTKDYVNGYFPINTTVVTNGAGASYDTKGYCEWPATTE